MCERLVSVIHANKDHNLRLYLTREGRKEICRNLRMDAEFKVWRVRDTSGRAMPGHDFRPQPVTGLGSL